MPARSRRTLIPRMPTWREYSPLPDTPIRSPEPWMCRCRSRAHDAAPVGQGQILLRNGRSTANPLNVSARQSDFNGGEIGLKNIELKHYEATVAGDAAYNPTNQAFRFQSDRDKFRPDPDSQAAKRACCHWRHGRTFRPQAPAPWTRPRSTRQFICAISRFDQERAGDFTIQAVSQGAEIKITGQSQFDQAELKIDGNIQAAR